MMDLIYVGAMRSEAARFDTLKRKKGRTTDGETSKKKACLKSE